ncbi:MAG: hypothetical protein ABW220_18050 [Burkholderiaceae bacterium]
MTTIPSPLSRPLPVAYEGTPSPTTRRQAARRALEAQTLAALAFDLLIFGTMARLGWELLMPWERVLDAADGLWLCGLLVCSGLWAAFIDRDLVRWRRLRRRASR